jgi:phosphinothricin acetyltransferase
VQEIYAPFVERTATTFETVVPSVGEMRDRIVSTSLTLPWLVAVGSGGVVGYAFASVHRARAAYQWSVDTSVYVADGWRGRGVGRSLFAELLGRVRSLGYVAAFAGNTLPNPASVALHESVGFIPVGVFRRWGSSWGRGATWAGGGFSWSSRRSSRPNRPEGDPTCRGGRRRGRRWCRGSSDLVEGLASRIREMVQSR